jgi:SNF2 family DNA or RNA helicase
VATTRERKPITEETRAEDERLRDELRKADIGKLKRLMKPLIVRRNKKK